MDDDAMTHGDDNHCTYTFILLVNFTPTSCTFVYIHVLFQATMLSLLLKGCLLF